MQRISASPTSTRIHGLSLRCEYQLIVHCTLADITGPIISGATAQHRAACVGQVTRTEGCLLMSPGGDMTAADCDVVADAGGRRLT